MQSGVRVLRVLRMRRGLTQTELGELVGLHQGEVSLAESGRRVRNLDLVAIHLGVADPDDLLLDIMSERGQEVLETAEYGLEKAVA